MLGSRLCVTLVVLLMSSGALGQEYTKEELQPSEVYGWTSPPAQEQLDADTIVVPPGQGAIFLPTLSNPADEPEFVVYSGSRRVGSGSFGERIVLAPGQYLVRVGSGISSQTLDIDVEVFPDETTLVPVTWGALRIEVVDDHNIPHRGGYELIQVSSRDILGVGYGVDILLGEQVQTWILPSDLYRVVQPGATYRSRSNFSTVFVPPGGLVRYRLVMEPGTGEFLGAGIVTPEEMGGLEGEEQIWAYGLVIGINGSLSIDQNTTGTGELFLDGSAGYHQDEHDFVSLLQVEEGILWIDPETGDALPLQKSADQLRVDLLYTYFFTELFGPYVRAGTRMALFPSSVLTTEDVSVTRNRLDGTTDTTEVPGGESYETADYLGEVLIWEGVGINMRILRTEMGQANFGVGLGLRHNLYNDLFSKDEGSASPNLVYNEVESSNQVGTESILSGSLWLTEFITYTTQFDFFLDFADFTEPTIDWQSTLSLRLLDFLSLDYSFELLRQPQVSSEVQLSHDLLLRFSWQII